MNFFEELDGNLIFRYDGECVMLTPWGDNSLRVRSSILSEMKEESIAGRKFSVKGQLSIES